MARVAPTVSALVERGDFSGQGGLHLGAYLPRAAELLSPVDLQCVKAAGVTFAVSAMERVIEERAKGVPAGRRRSARSWQAASAPISARWCRARPKPQKLKEALIADGLWSQYLEVAIGPDAEVFTKAPPLSSVGWGDYVGIRTQSTWNNPEPEDRGGGGPRAARRSARPWATT